VPGFITLKKEFGPVL